MLIRIPQNHTFIEGEISIPKGAQSIVIFAHGSGSSRHSIRNIFVSDYLKDLQIGTLLINLFSEEDPGNGQIFDLKMFSDRLQVATQWIKNNPATKHFKVGFFGASTGAAVALHAAANIGLEVGAVVSRGGRPDLILDKLEKIQAPTLFIVGDEDYEVKKINNYAYKYLVCKKKIEIIPNATHLFEEAGTLEEAAKKSAEWFNRFLN